MYLPRSSTKRSGHDLPHPSNVPARQLLCGQNKQDAEGAEAVQEQPQEHRHEVQAQPSHQVREGIDLHYLGSN